MDCVPLMSAFVEFDPDWGALSCYGSVSGFSSHPGLQASQHMSIATNRHLGTMGKSKDYYSGFIKESWNLTSYILQSQAERDEVTLECLVNAKPLIVCNSES